MSLAQIGGRVALGWEAGRGCSSVWLGRLHVCVRRSTYTTNIAPYVTLILSSHKQHRKEITL